MAKVSCPLYTEPAMATYDLRTSLLLFLLTAFSVAGCGSADRSLYVAVGQLGPDTDPTRTAELSSLIVGRGIYEGLLKQDIDGILLPNLAETWQYDTTGTRLTLKLREGVLFHDGVPLTGEIASRILNGMMKDSGSEDWSGATPSLLGDPVAIRATGPYSLEILLERPHRPLLRILSTTTVAPMRRFPEPGGPLQQAVGTGPFRLVSYAPEDSTAVLEAFEAYWGRRAFAQRIVFRGFSNASDGIDALEGGRMDIATLFSMPDVNRVNTSPHMHLVSSRPASYICIGLNSQRAPFDDPAARRALSLAFDRGVVASSYYRSAAVFTRSFVGRHLFPEIDAPLSPARDPEAARALIRDIPELRSMTVRLLVTPSSTPSREHWLDTPVEDLFEDFGLSVEVIQSETFGDFVTRVDEGDWEMSWDGLSSDTRDLYEFLHVLYGTPATQGGYGLFGMADPRVPALIDSGRIQRTVEEAKQYYRRALERVADYQPCVPFMDMKGFMARNSEVEPFSIQDAITIDLGSIHKKGWR